MKRFLIVAACLALAVVCLGQLKVSQYPNTNNASATDLVLLSVPGVTNKNITIQDFLRYVVSNYVATAISNYASLNSDTLTVSNVTASRVAAIDASKILTNLPAGSPNTVLVPANNEVGSRWHGTLTNISIWGLEANTGVSLNDYDVLVGTTGLEAWETLGSTFNTLAEGGTGHMYTRQSLFSKDYYGTNNWLITIYQSAYANNVLYNHDGTGVTNRTINADLPKIDIFATNGMTLTNFSNLESGLGTKTKYVDMAVWGCTSTPAVVTFPTFGAGSYAVRVWTNDRTPIILSITNGTRVRYQWAFEGTNITLINCVTF